MSCWMVHCGLFDCPDIAHGGVAFDGGDGWVAALASVKELSCDWLHVGCLTY